MSSKLKKNRLACATLLAIVSMSSAVQAEGLKISGFGTVGAIYSSLDEADFTINTRKPNGAGRSRSVDFSNLTVAGVQVDYALNRQWSTALQVKSEMQWDGSYNPEVALASLTYQPSAAWRIQVGRLAFPAYPSSDFLSIGYSLPWTYAPVDVYHINHISRIDGASVTYRHTLGDVNLTAQVFGGYLNQSASSNDGEAVFTSHNKGWALAAEYGSHMGRIAHMQGKSTLQNDKADLAFNLMRTLPANFGGNAALADQYEPVDKNVGYTTLGYTYDPGNYFIIAEAARLNGSTSTIMKSTGYYILGGYRYNNFTPFGWYSRTHVNIDTKNKNPILNQMVGINAKGQHSIGAGLRWDFYKNMDWKIQVQHSHLESDAEGPLSNATSAHKKGSRYNVISTSLDVVF